MAENFEAREWLVRFPGSSDRGLCLQCGGWAGRAGVREVGVCGVSQGEAMVVSTGGDLGLPWTYATGSQERQPGLWPILLSECGMPRWKEPEGQTGFGLGLWGGRPVAHSS